MLREINQVSSNWIAAHLSIVRPIEIIFGIWIKYRLLPVVDLALLWLELEDLDGLHECSLLMVESFLQLFSPILSIGMPILQALQPQDQVSHKVSVIGVEDPVMDSQPRINIRAPLQSYLSGVADMGLPFFPFLDLITDREQGGDVEVQSVREAMPPLAL